MRVNRSDDIVSKNQLSAPIHPPLWRMGHSPVWAAIDGSFGQRGNRAEGQNLIQIRVCSGIDSLKCIIGIKYPDRLRGNWGSILDHSGLWVFSVWGTVELLWNLKKYLHGVHGIRDWHSSDDCLSKYAACFTSGWEEDLSLVRYKNTAFKEFFFHDFIFILSNTL